MGPRKECSVCKWVLPHSDFYKHSHGMFGLTSKCKKCHCEMTAKWAKNNREQVVANHNRWNSENRERIRAQAKARRWKDVEKSREKERKKSVYSAYGITFEQKEAMFEAQGRKCAACGGDEPRSKKGWHIDHCHDSGRIRGILCHSCNASLGNAGDSAERLHALIAYLRKNSV